MQFVTNLKKMHQLYANIEVKFILTNIKLIKMEMLPVGTTKIHSLVLTHSTLLLHLTMPAQISGHKSRLFSLPGAVLYLAVKRLPEQDIAR